MSYFKARILRKRRKGQTPAPKKNMRQQILALGLKPFAIGTQQYVGQPPVFRFDPITGHMMKVRTGVPFIRL